MKTIKAYKFKLKPTAKQKRKLNMAMGCARWGPECSDEYQGEMF